MKKIMAVFLSLHLILSPVALANDTFRNDSNGDSGGWLFYTNQILSLTTGLIGTSILSTCKLGATQPSIYIFFAGSLAYIGSEIFAGKDQDKFHQRKVGDLAVDEKKLKGGDVQKSILNTALDEEKNNLDYIKSKKTWMIAVMTAYYAAMAMAIIETWWKVPPPAGPGKPDDAGCSGGYGSGWASDLAMKALIAAYTYGSTRAGGDGAISTWGGMAVGLAAMSKTFNKAVSSAYSSSIGRAITFGVSGGIATGIVVGLSQRQSIAESNIEKMTKVRDGLKDSDDKLPNDDGGADGGSDGGNDGGSDGGSNGGVNSGNGMAGRSYKLKELPKGEVAKSCWTQTNNQLDYSQSGCTQPLKLTKTNFDFNLGVPTLQNAGQHALEMGRAVAEGNMAKANIAAGNLAAMAGKVKEIKDQLEKKLNDHLKATGEKPIDFNKNINSQIASLQAQVQKATGMPSIASQTASAGQATLSKEEPKTQSPTVASVNTAPAAPTVPGLDSNLDFGLNDQTPPSEGTDQVAAAQSLNDFELADHDISKQSDVSIFKQLSNRYLLNYTRMFPEKKGLEKK